MIKIQNNRSEIERALDYIVAKTEKILDIQKYREG